MDEPLTFLVHPEQASQEVILGALESCLTGRDGDHQCTGPLFDHVAGLAPARGGLEPGEGPLLCGRPVEIAGKPLYPMPQGDGACWELYGVLGDWTIRRRAGRSGVGVSSTPSSKGASVASSLLSRRAFFRKP